MFEQERVIMRLQQRVLGEKDIVVCFLAGSYGRRIDDAYSDLDVALIFADKEQRALAWQRRIDFVNSLLPYITCNSFDADHIRPFFHIALYGNGAKVDYRYETQESLAPNPWDRDIRLLKDSQGWGERFQAASAMTSMIQPRMSAAELEALDRRFWVMFMDVYRQLLRGDHDKPFTIYLELLHFSLPPLLRLLPPEDSSRSGLLQASFGPDTGAAVTHMAELLDAYLAARGAIIQRLHLAFTSNSSFERAILNIVKRTS